MCDVEKEKKRSASIHIEQKRTLEIEKPEEIVRLKSDLSLDRSKKKEVYDATDDGFSQLELEDNVKVLEGDIPDEAVFIGFHRKFAKKIEGEKGRMPMVREALARYYKNKDKGKEDPEDLKNIIEACKAYSRFRFTFLKGETGAKRLEEVEDLKNEARRMLAEKLLDDKENIGESIRFERNAIYDEEFGEDNIMADNPGLITYTVGLSRRRPFTTITIPYWMVNREAADEKYLEVPKRKKHKKTVKEPEVIEVVKKKKTDQEEEKQEKTNSTEQVKKKEDSRITSDKNDTAIKLQMIQKQEEDRKKAEKKKAEEDKKRKEEEEKKKAEQKKKEEEEKKKTEQKKKEEEEKKKTEQKKKEEEEKKKAEQKKKEEEEKKKTKQKKKEEEEKKKAEQKKKEEAEKAAGLEEKALMEELKKAVDKKLSAQDQKLQQIKKVKEIHGRYILADLEAMEKRIDQAYLRAKEKIEQNRAHVMVARMGDIIEPDYVIDASDNMFKERFYEMPGSKKYSLFYPHDDIKAEAVLQDKKINDSYFIAALAALALRDPAYIKEKLIKDDPADEKMAIVRLYDEKGHPQNIRVKKTKSSDVNRPMWVDLVEKAACVLLKNTEGGAAFRYDPKKEKKDWRNAGIADRSLSRNDIHSGSQELAARLLFGRDGLHLGTRDLPGADTDYLKDGTSMQVLHVTGDEVIGQILAYSEAGKSITATTCTNGGSLKYNRKKDSVIFPVDLEQNHEFVVYGEGEKTAGQRTLRIRDIRKQETVDVPFGIFKICFSVVNISGDEA